MTSWPRQFVGGRPEQGALIRMNSQIHASIWGAPLLAPTQQMRRIRTLTMDIPIRRMDIPWFGTVTAPSVVHCTGAYGRTALYARIRAAFTRRAGEAAGREPSERAMERTRMETLQHSLRGVRSFVQELARDRADGQQAFISGHRSGWWVAVRARGKRRLRPLPFETEDGRYVNSACGGCFRQVPVGHGPVV